MKQIGSIYELLISDISSFYEHMDKRGFDIIDFDYPRNSRIVERQDSSDINMADLCSFGSGRYEIHTRGHEPSRLIQAVREFKDLRANPSNASSKTSLTHLH